MLNLITRATRQCIPVLESLQIKQTALTLRVQAYASFTARAILNERSDESGTLLNRFAKHIALECITLGPDVPTTIRYSNYFPVTDMRYFKSELGRTSAEQLPALITFAFTYRPSADPNKFAPVLNELDAAAMHHLDDMDVDTVLRTLYAFLFLMPNWMTRLDFYHAAVRRLVQRDFAGDVAISKDKFIQSCFYLGLAKKQAIQNCSQLLQQLLQCHLQTHLSELSTMDLAVVANAAYKTATTIQSDAYNQQLEKEVLALPLDGAHDAILVTLIKAMRLQRVRSPQVCQHLEQICSNENALRQLQSRGLVHVLAYFAESLWDNADCTAALITEFMLRLAKSNQAQLYEEIIRGKDIAAFLWSCGQLNAALSTVNMQRINAVLLQKVHNNEFDYFADHLVDSCLSLWQLGHRSQDLLQAAVQLKSEIVPNSKQPKVDNRLTVLLAAAAIEQPTWNLKQPKKANKPFDATATVPAYIQKNYTNLTNYVSQLNEEADITDVKLCLPINGINIPSLLVTFDNTADAPVYVEVLNEMQTLRFSGAPIGILRLKIRLLKASEQKVIVLHQKDIEQNGNNIKQLITAGEATKDDDEKRSVSSI